MHKVSVSVPAVSTNVGPGYDVLGLALNLRNVIEMSLTPGDQLDVAVQGEGDSVLPGNVYNPVMRAAIKLFQKLEQAPVGLTVRSTNRIPFDVGLSARATMFVGGLVGANNLIGNPFSHEDLISLAAEITSQPESVVTAMRGGLGVCSRAANGSLLYRAIETMPLRVVVAVPHLPGYQHRLRDALPANVPLQDAVHNIGNTALLIEALRDGDFRLLREVCRDRLHEAHRIELIPGYAAAVEAATNAGADAVTLSGAGPAMLAFAGFNHQSIESAIQAGFAQAGVDARTWSIGIDLQGVVISVVE
jgi:homoserine kinase